MMMSLSPPLLDSPSPAPDRGMLPAQALPAAFLRFRNLTEEQGRSLGSLLEIPGVRRLDDQTLGVHPLQGRAEVFDIALSIARGIQRRVQMEDRGNFPGILIFPGNLRVGDRSVEVVSSPLLEDLGRQGPDLDAGRVCVTGYVASWLAGRFRLGPGTTWSAPSGRRIPIFEVLGRSEGLAPWHNRTLLGREKQLARPALEAELASGLQGPVLRVTGGLGAGKTLSTWLALSGPKQWVGLGRGSTRAGEIGPALAEIFASWNGTSRGDRSDGARLARSPVSKQVEWLCLAAEAVRERLRVVPSIMIDDLQTAGAADVELLGQLMVNRTFHNACRLVLVGRSGAPNGSPIQTLPSVPQVDVPPMAADEMAQLFDGLLDSVELEGSVRDRFFSASAGFPFAFEEGLIRLLHENKVRSVYGSYFYAGEAGQPYDASERLVRHAAAEAERLGASVAVTMLALADHSIESQYAVLAAQRFGLEIEGDWYRPYIDAGWLEARALSDPSNAEIRFVYPAIARALRRVVDDEGRGRLRHALGSILAGSERDDVKWSAYRLMAGSPEALPPLLDYTRGGSTGVVSTRDEVFFALWREHKEAVERGVDGGTELRILWVLLPLARRLGRLSELAKELSRGVELARGDGQKWVPLVALQAELDMERGDFRGAESGLREALSASEGLGRQRRATLFIRLGALLQREGRYEEATQVFERLLTVVEKHGATALGASCRYYLGNIALDQKRVEEAQRLHREAADFRRLNDLQKPLGVSLSALGSVALTEGDYATALQYFGEAEDVLTAAKAEPWDLSFAYLGKGRALGQLGEITRATKSLRAALEAREGRQDTINEAAARLEVAKNLLALDQDTAALEAVRQAHFQLSLTEEISLLGDAELMLGRILLKQKDLPVAKEHLLQALKIHRKHDAVHELAEGHSWLVELAIQESESVSVRMHAAELKDLIEDLEFPAKGEQLFFRLYRGFLWLEEKGSATPDPMAWLRRAYQELMRKTNFLQPERRHSFLYQVRAHQDILNSATQHQISLPVFTVGSKGEIPAG